MPTPGVEIFMSQVVYVVDDDDAVRGSVAKLARITAPVHVQSYESGDAFLAEPAIHPHGCLILDMRMPGTTGPDVMDELRSRGIRLPIILMSGHSDSLPAEGDLPPNVLALLQKPFRPKKFMALLREALLENDGESEREAHRES